MKITLIWPNTPEKSSSLYPPLGLGYIGAILQSKGYSPEVYDLTFKGAEEKIPDDSDIYGFSVTTPLSRNALRLASNIRKKNPRATIIFGGAHLALSPDDIIRHPAVDIICIGEGEMTLLDIVQRLEAGQPICSVPGIAYKEKDGTIKFTEPRQPTHDLDELPMPAMDLFPLKSYFEATGIRQLGMLTTRGCPGNCTFCQPMLRKIFGPTLRFRSAHNILNEITFMVDRHRLDMLMMVDDNFTQNPKNVAAVCRGMMERGIDVLWRCAGRVETPRETLALMKKAGCVGICFGVESGSQKILDGIQKHVKIKDIRTAFDRCHEIGLLTHAFIMVGNIGEDQTTVQQTMDLISEIKPFNINVSITTPYPGTQLYDHAKRNGLLLSEDWGRYNHITEDSAGIKLEKMSPGDVVAAKKKIELFFGEQARSYRHGQLLKSLDLNMLARLARMSLKDPSLVFRLLRLRTKIMAQAGFSFFK